jgi:hypothetical protein
MSACPLPSITLHHPRDFSETLHTYHITNTHFTLLQFWSPPVINTNNRPVNLRGALINKWICFNILSLQNLIQYFKKNHFKIAILLRFSFICVRSFNEESDIPELIQDQNVILQIWSHNDELQGPKKENWATVLAGPWCYISHPFQ